MTALACEISRKKFATALHRKSECVDRALWIFHNREIATKTELDYAERYLRSQGWNEFQVAAARLNGNRMDGRVRSIAKTLAARSNGLKGGRPRKVIPQPDLTPQTIAASVQAGFDAF